MQSKLKKIIMVIMSVFALSLGMSFTVADTAYAAIDIRPGAADDNASGIMRGLRKGWADPATAQEMVNNGAFSPDVAVQVQAVIDEVTGRSNQAQQSVIEEPKIEIKEETCTHNYTNEITTEATCLYSGIITYTCNKCGDSYTKETEALQHDYKQYLTTEATCTEPGIVLFRCVNCEDEYSTEYDALGHEVGEWEQIGEATCTRDGKERKICIRCEAILEERKLEAVGHTEPEGWTTLRLATLVEEGEKALLCKACGEIIQTEIIPANTWQLIVSIIMIIAGIVLAIVKGKGKKHDKK